KDVFLEVGSLYATAGTQYGIGPGAVVDGVGHNHLPAPPVIKLIGDAFKNAPVVNLDGSTGIQLHVDVGPNYHALGGGYASNEANDYIIPATHARGGESILEVGCEVT